MLLAIMAMGQGFTFPDYFMNDSDDLKKNCILPTLML
jgi:hypothetical protein